ncbi:repeat-containing protein [Moumouvirus goulette]|uniref:Repeat-containing protein n=1 Tax=Moumouvirus goulette TaxID=1247379 RepID=M1PGA1_9VIRU|nr:repeat-containing protein [Moumouvirus goulette]AGF85008.1 repeat-containing protein [Moumouvirus goulette]
MLQSLNFDTILHLFDYLDDKDKISFMSTCQDLFNIKNSIKIQNLYSYHIVKDSIFLSSFRKISFNTKNIDIPINTTHLYFCDSFNKSLPKLNEVNCLTNNLKFIKFGWNFNQSIKGCIPNNVTHLIFGNRFNQDILGCIPESVIYLEFGTSFNKSVENCLPKNLKYLKFGFKFNQNIDNCIPDVKYLEFGHYFNQRINNCSINKKYGLPSSLKYLIFKQEFNQSITRCIPHGVKILKFGKKFNQNIKYQLPLTLKYLSICNPQGKNYNILNDLPTSVKKIHLTGYFTEEFIKLFREKIIIETKDEFINYLKQISDHYKNN